MPKEDAEKMFVMFDMVEKLNNALGTELVTEIYVNENANVKVNWNFEDVTLQ